MSNAHEKQQIIHQYKDENDVTEADMHDVARWGVEKGYLKKPQPIDPYDQIAKELSKAARLETRYDKNTQRPYRVNHRFLAMRDGRSVTLWGDIDDASFSREKMELSLQLRRSQALGDCIQMSLDEEHWNASHPGENPIQMVLDFALDVEWAKNSPHDGQQAS